MVELYRSENLVVRCVPMTDRDRWVVTFDNFGIGHGFDRPGFGQEFFQARGVSAIHVMGRSEDWYQYPDISPALASVRNFIAGSSRVMTYGSSMGGYAAIRFADAVGAHAALALSPQYTIDPAKPPFDDRWTQHSHAIAWLPQIDGPVTCQCCPVIVFDPKSADGLHAARFARDIDTTEIPLPHTAHPVATFLSEVGALEPLVFGVLDGTLDAEATRRRAWQARRQSLAYLNELTRIQPDYRMRSAIRLARLTCQIGRDDGKALAALAERLSLAGEHAEALLLYERALSQGERTVTLLASYANALVASGDSSKAREIAFEVMEALPHMAYLWAWYAGICWFDAKPSTARRAIAKAVALDPSNAAYTAQRQLYHGSDVVPVDDASSVPWLLRGRQWASRRQGQIAERQTHHRTRAPAES